MRPVYSVVTSPNPGTPGATAYVRRSVKLPQVCGVIWTVLTFPKTLKRRFGVRLWVRRWWLEVDVAGGFHG